MGDVCAALGLKWVHVLGATQACVQLCMPYLISVGKGKGTQASKAVLCAPEDELHPCCWCNTQPISACNHVSAVCGTRLEGSYV